MSLVTQPKAQEWASPRLLTNLAPISRQPPKQKLTEPYTSILVLSLLTPWALIKCYPPFPTVPTLWCKCCVYPCFNALAPDSQLCVLCVLQDTAPLHVRAANRNSTAILPLLVSLLLMSCSYSGLQATRIHDLALLHARIQFLHRLSQMSIALLLRKAISTIIYALDSNISKTNLK